MTITIDSKNKVAASKARILLAEDIGLNQMLLQAQLEQYDYEVQAVNNGQEALDALMLGQYDLVLMDIQMPVMNGIDATKKIRNELKISDKKLPIIAITAYNIPYEMREYLEVGFNDCLTKPISSQALNTVVESWLTPK